jgi:CheY-like chemotaxis protein
MRRKLLLADDSVTIQRVIELTFADEDIDVVAVGDGDAAIARLDSAPPDIVLADVGMPGRDGYEVAMYVHLKPALAHIPVVLLTGALQPVDDAKAREAGCAGVLVKPFEPHMVIAKVRELLDKREVSTDARAGERPAAAGRPAGAESSPADAIMSAPPSAQAGVQTQDDYFAQLDAAFASLNTQAASGAPPPATAARAAAAPPSPTASDTPSSPEPSAARPFTMADAFSALLTLEQGGSSRAPDEWPTALTALVDEMTRRVAEQVADRIIREVARDIVTRVAERVVREEIDRLRQDIESS